jgi:hypothetical protein
MIQRVVVVKLKDAYSNDETRALVKAKTLEVLKDAHGVVGLEVGLPCDERSRKSWDLCIFVRFRSMADVEIYKDDKIHRAYADVFLKPLWETIKVWNFDVDA